MTTTLDATEAETAPTLESDSPDTPPDLELRVEAVLMSLDRPRSSGQLASLLDLPTLAGIEAAIESLNKVYQDTSRSFRIEKIAGGWQILTLPGYAEVLAQARKTDAGNKLSPAAMETLAIIAYKQPITRADVEAIRGVGCGEVIRGLMERKLVKSAGRAEVLGRPMLYATTTQFLTLFGLDTVKDLPKPEDWQLGG